MENIFLPNNEFERPTSKLNKLNFLQKKFFIYIMGIIGFLLVVYFLFFNAPKNLGGFSARSKFF